MIKLADLKGNEAVLDLGTGSGFLAINFAKQLKDGKVIGIDRYSIKYDSLRAKLFYFFKINFIGHSLKNGMRNLKIEKMEKKCKLISSDLTKPLNFPDKHFDIILSSQTIYCLPPQKRLPVYKEINRVLKKDGKIIFFESKAYIGWDINDLKNYFEKQGYQINILPDEKYRGRCILFGKKK
jgi:ubiquinone/menaquinone biosynthesis C-methylase UbiE